MVYAFLRRSIHVRIFINFLFTASIQNKQLVADKAYLEEQLKARGTKKRFSEIDSRRGQSNYNDRGTSLHNISQSVSSVEESKTESADSSLLQKSKESLLDDSKVDRPATVTVKKEINILDDLEKEINKQRLQEQRNKDWHTSVVRMKGLRGGEESGRRRRSGNTSESKAEVRTYVCLFFLWQCESSSTRLSMV